MQQLVGTAAGSPVVRADDPPGSGFTGGFAAVVHLADGRRVFAKAGSSRNPHLVAAYAQEARVLAALPSGAPAARYVGQGHLDAGTADEHEWQVVVAEALDGRLPQPWTEPDLEAVHAACRASVDALTPAPDDLDLPELADDLSGDAEIVSCFERLASGELALTWGQPAWLPQRYAELHALVAAVPEHLTGDTACHFDLRADNVLVGPYGAVFVDWNWLVRGAAWTDFVGLLPLVRADGLDAEGWLARSPLTRDVDPAAVDTWLATIAAYMLAHADDPLWPGGPELVRVHQRRYARTFLDWLGARRGWDVG
ncbi:hypothetical protein GCM10027446_16780 [Angustibacter peucedani]